MGHLTNWPAKLIVTRFLYARAVEEYGEEWAKQSLEIAPHLTLRDIDDYFEPDKHHARLGPRKFPPGTFPEGQLCS